MIVQVLYIQMMVLFLSIISLLSSIKIPIENKEDTVKQWCEVNLSSQCPRTDERSPSLNPPAGRLAVVADGNSPDISQLFGVVMNLGISVLEIE